jgi:hypothetical protein
MAARIETMATDTPNRFSPRCMIEFILVLLASAALGAAYAVSLGQDLNWDWQNYHSYAGYAAATGRFDLDVAPSGIQTYLNPYIYVPIHALRATLSPIWAAGVLGAIQGLNLCFVWFLTRHLVGPGRGVLLPLLATAIAASGPIALSEMGTSFVDVLVSQVVIIGLLLIIPPAPPMHGDQAQAGSPARIVGAGLLFGLAFGLKLTSAIFVIGAIVAVLIGRRPVRNLFLLAVGGGIGGLIGGGWWMFRLWQTFGSPLFPFYNALFGSPDGPGGNLQDTRFLPHGLVEALAYPVLWMLGEHRTAEIPFRDARFVVIMALMLMVAGAMLARRAWLLDRRHAQFLGFFAASYVVWLSMFAIHRYAAALEFLAGPLIILLLLPLVGRVMQVAAAALLAGVIGIWSIPADWGHRPFHAAYVEKVPEGLSVPATYFITGKPLGFVTTALPAESRFFTVGDGELPIQPGHVFARRIEESLRNPLPGGFWMIRFVRQGDDSSKVIPYGLELDSTRSCIRFGAVVHGDAEACPLRPVANAPR